MSLAIPDHVSALAHPDLSDACAAVHEAAKIILKYWHNPPSVYLSKSDCHYDLVSEVDELADAAIHKILNARHPTDQILSEEINPDPTSMRIHVGRVWIVDPLDGTSSFLFKTDVAAPAVMIALIVDGTTDLSVVCQPMINRWSYAVRGKGSFRDGVRMYMQSTYESLVNSWIDMNHYGDVAFESDTFRRIDRIVRSNGGARLVSRSVPYSAVALKLLVPEEKEQKLFRGLAACVHDHNPDKPKQLPWDIVPIQLIVEEAGGVYMDSLRGPQECLNPFELKGAIVISNAKLASEIYTRITKQHPHKV